MDIVTSLTATTDFFLRPTTNRFVACSMSSAGCSPAGGGPTRRSGSRAGSGAGALFGSFTTWIIVPSVPIRPCGPLTPRAASRWLGPRLLVRPLWASKNRGPYPAHGSSVCFGGPPPTRLPRPGHRSPIDSAAIGRATVRHEGANEETHCRQIAPCFTVIGWPGHPRAARAAVECRRSLRPAFGECQAITPFVLEHQSERMTVAADLPNVVKWA